MARDARRAAPRRHHPVRMTTGAPREGLSSASRIPERTHVVLFLFLIAPVVILVAAFTLVDVFNG
jgi:hypothetical protein